MTLRNNRTLRTVAAALLEQPDGRHWVYDLRRRTGISPEVLYRLLTQLLSEGWLRDGWEDPRETATGRPPRQYFTLTDRGRELFQAIVDDPDMSLSRSAHPDPRRRLLIRVGAMGTLLAGLIAGGAGLVLDFQALNGQGPSGTPTPFVLVIALLPLFIGAVLLWTGAQQMQLRDDGMRAPRIVALLLLPSLGAFSVILSGNDDPADVPGDLVMATLLLLGALVLLGLAGMASWLLQQETERRP